VLLLLYWKKDNDPIEKTRFLIADGFILEAKRS
jgi:hypothetical protein